MIKSLHEKRGVTFQELGALLAVREMLKQGLLEHSLERQQLDKIKNKHVFSMGNSGECNTSCGSIGCIGGYMSMIMHPDITGNLYVRNYRSHSLNLLFFPPNEVAGWDWEKITPKQAIKAIDNWLATGKPQWEKVIPKRKAR